MLVPSVFAVGILVPQELSDDGNQYFKVGVERSMDFVIKGDAQAHDVEFFATVDGWPSGKYLTFNGVGDYNKNLFLSAFEEQKITVTFRGEDKFDDDWLTVRYGFKYTSDSESGIGLEQVVENSFKARVKCASCSVPSTTTSEPSSSSGGGGGGGLPPSNSTVVNFGAEEVAPEQPATNDNVQISAIDGGTTALTEGKATVPSGFTTSVAKAAQAGASATKDGKPVLLLLIGMLVVMMVIETAAIRVAKEAEE